MIVNVKAFTPLFLILVSISDLSSSHGFICAKAGKAISIDATTAKRLFISDPLSWLSSFKSLPKHNSPYATRKSRSVEIHEKTRRRRVFLASRFRGPRNLLRVAAQPVREFRERADAARFGAVAPVLQLTHELCAHRVHGVKRARLCQTLLEVRALRLAQRFFVAM